MIATVQALYFIATSVLVSPFIFAFAQRYIDRQEEVGRLLEKQYEFAKWNDYNSLSGTVRDLKEEVKPSKK